MNSSSSGRDIFPCLPSSFVRLATSLLCVYERKETNQWDPAGGENPCLSSTSFLGTFPSYPTSGDPPTSHHARSALTSAKRETRADTGVHSEPPQIPPFSFWHTANERTNPFLFDESPLLAGKQAVVTSGEASQGDSPTRLKRVPNGLFCWGPYVNLFTRSPSSCESHFELCMQCKRGWRRSPKGEAGSHLGVSKLFNHGLCSEAEARKNLVLLCRALWS